MDNPFGRDMQKCFLCQNENSKDIFCDNFAGYAYNCPNCGNYRITRYVYYTSPKSEDHFFERASAIACERKLKNDDGYTLELDSNTGHALVGDRDFLADYPKDFNEKFERALMNIARLTNFNPLSGVEINEKESQLLFCPDMLEGKKILELMKNEGLVDFYPLGLQPKASNVHLTFDGWKKVNLIKNSVDDRCDAFIAMWFDDSTKTFRTAVKQAIEQAGYTPRIIDEDHHNDFIMDRVLNLITESRFIITDLTCKPEECSDKIKNGVRGGVYFEAGYAKGLGLPVIFTCKDDKEAFDRRHFDVNQINTIMWKECNNELKTGVHDFIEYLRERIIATVGKGPKFKK